ADRLLDLERAGRQERRLGPAGGNRIQVLPPIALPRKYQASVRSPEQLLSGVVAFAYARDIRVELMKDAACAVPGTPPFLSEARRGIGGPNRPRLLAAARAKDRHARPRGLAHEGDLPTVRRPRRESITIDGRREVHECIAAHVVHADKGVRGAIAHEREPRAV